MKNSLLFGCDFSRHNLFLHPLLVVVVPLGMSRRSWRRILRDILAHALLRSIGQDVSLSIQRLEGIVEALARRGMLILKLAEGAVLSDDIKAFDIHLSSDILRRFPDIILHEGEIHHTDEPDFIPLIAISKKRIDLAPHVILYIYLKVSHGGKAYGMLSERNLHHQKVLVLIRIFGLVFQITHTLHIQILDDTLPCALIRLEEEHEVGESLVVRDGFCIVTLDSLSRAIIIIYIIINNTALN